MSKKITLDSMRFFVWGLVFGCLGVGCFGVFFIKSRTKKLMIERGELIKIWTDNLILFAKLLGKVQHHN